MCCIHDLLCNNLVFGRNIVRIYKPCVFVTTILHVHYKSGEEGVMSLSKVTACFRRPTMIGGVQTIDDVQKLGQGILIQFAHIALTVKI